MNKNPIVPMYLVIVCLFPWTANPQVRAIDQAEVQRAVTGADYARLYEIARTGCVTREGAVDPTLTVERRLAAATEARRCMEELRGRALAPSTFEERASVDALFDPLVEESRELEEEARAEKEFLDLNWGLGFGYSISFDDAIDEATIVDGVVRVTSRKDNEPRVLLEFHKYFWCNNNRTDGTRGCGPFIAVAAKEDDMLGGVGIGLMYGRKVNETDTDGFSVGIGAILDSDIRDLGDGFAENQPPPGTETEVRFETKSRWGAIAFVTRTF